MYVISEKGQLGKEKLELIDGRKHNESVYLLELSRSYIYHHLAYILFLVLYHIRLMEY